MLIDVTKSNRKGKRYVGVFKNGTKTHFGSANGKTYLDHKDKAKREAYKARAKGVMMKTDKYSPSKLSYYLLWGESTNLKDAIKKYNARFF